MVPRRIRALGALDVVQRARSVFSAYGRHACSEHAAAIAYRVLFSLVPFIALLAAIVDAVLPDTARADVVGWLLGAFPGDTVENGVEQELAATSHLLSLAGVIAFMALAWTATGMTRSLRIALAVVWETGTRPAFVRAKLRDLAALGVLAALILAVFALSLITQVAVQAGSDLSSALGFGGAATILPRVAELLVTGAATFVGLVLVYRMAAPVAVSVSDVWRATLMIAIGIDVGLAIYAFYLVNIANLSSIYGPLGAILAFLTLLYTAAIMVLFGAELIVARLKSRESSSEAGDAPQGRTADHPSMTPSYGEPVTWAPATPRIGLLRLLVSLAILTASVYVAAAIVPGVSLDRPAAGLVVALALALLNTVVPPVLAALRLPFMVAIGFIGILLVDAGLLLLVDAVFPDWHPRGRVRRRAADVGRDGGRRDRAAGRLRHQRRRRVPAQGHAADRQPARARAAHGRARDHLPRDRRARAAGAAARDARRQRADHGPLDRRARLPPGRVGDRPLLADRREPGGHPARLQRGHPVRSAGSRRRPGG